MTRYIAREENLLSRKTLLLWWCFRFITRRRDFVHPFANVASLARHRRAWVSVTWAAEIPTEIVWASVIWRTWSSARRIVKVSERREQRAHRWSDSRSIWRLGRGWISSSFPSERGEKLVCREDGGKRLAESLEKTQFERGLMLFAELAVLVYNKKSFANLYWKLVTLEARDWWVASERGRAKSSLLIVSQHRRVQAEWTGLIAWRNIKQK